MGHGLQYVHLSHLFIAPGIVLPRGSENPNDFIDRLWLLRMNRWAQRGLKFLAKDQIEEAVDQELVAEAVEALQTVVNLTQPAEIRKMESAHLLALVDRVQLLLSEGNNHQN